MRTSHQASPLSLAHLGISPEVLRRIARACGFCVRQSGKIQPSDVLLQMCLESIKGTVSHNDLAARIEATTGVSVSRQAYWERCDAPCVRLFQQVLAWVIAAKCRASKGCIGELIKTSAYQRILLQDSTIIQLPARLFTTFSGVQNATSTVCNARIQCVYDLKAGAFLKFTIDPYSKNDFLAALEIELQPGDLVLRDRGYFTVAAVRKHSAAAAHCIVRYKHKTVLLDPHTGAPIQLLELLRRNRVLDMTVLVGATEKLSLRLLAAPIDEETANLRRMRARKEMHGHAPSQELLALMSWSIFLTTIVDPALGFQQIWGLYGLRWRIENIFKTWKSNFSFAKVHRVSESQLRVLLTARFIMIVVLYQALFLPLTRLAQATTANVLSLLKFMRYITSNLNRIPILMNCSSPANGSFRALLRYCVYDKRKRPNFVSQTAHILTEIDNLMWA
jgi:hypothetical protein